MSLLATLPVTVAIFWLPGACLWRRFGWEGARFGEAVLVQVLLSLATGSLALILLGDLGVFTSLRLAALQTIVAIAGLLGGGSLGARSAPERRELLAVALLVTAAILYSRPHEQILGGSDMGTYVSAGSEIARSGGFEWTKRLLPSLPSELVEQSVRVRPELVHLFGYESSRFPGFFVENIARGTETPQFFFLLPAWIGVFIDLWGPYAGLFAPPIFAVISTLAAFYLFWRIADFATASLGSFLLATNLLQVWFSRSPLSEVLVELWILGGLLALALFERSRRPLLGWLAGAYFGLCFFTRLDAFLVPALAAAVLMGGERLRSRLWWLHFGLPLFLTTLLATIQAGTFGSYYLLNTWRMIGAQMYFQKGITLSHLVMAAAVTVGIAVLAYAIARRRRIASPGTVRASLAVAVLLAGAYAYWLRPLLPPPHPDKLNFFYLAWYLTRPVALCAVIGSALYLHRGRSVAGTLLVAIGLTYGALYLWENRTTLHQIFMMRRYVFAPLPLACFAAAFAAAALPRRSLRIGVGGILLVTTLLRAAPLYGHSDLRGVFGLTEGLAGRIPADAVVVAQSSEVVDSLAVPLTYLWDRNVLLLSAANLFRQETLDSLRGIAASGRPVWYLGETRSGSIWEGPDPQVFAASVRYLENVYFGIPRRILWHWIRVSLAPIDDEVLSRASREREAVARDVLEPGSVLLDRGDGAEVVAGEIYELELEKTALAERPEQRPISPAPVEVFSVGYKAHARLASLREAGIEADLHELLGYWWLSGFRSGIRVNDVTRQARVSGGSDRDLTRLVTDRDFGTAAVLPAVDENRHYRIEADLGAVEALQALTIFPAAEEEYLPAQLILEVSRDGAQWERVWHRPRREPFLVLCGKLPLEDRTGRIRVFLPEPVQARYVRILASVSRPERTWSVAEILLYAAGEEQGYFSCSAGIQPSSTDSSQSDLRSARVDEEALQRQRLTLRSAQAGG